MDKSNHSISNKMNELLILKAMDHVNEAVLITNGENRVIYINKKLEEITGYLFKELEGKHP